MNRGDIHHAHDQRAFPQLQSASTQFPFNHWTHEADSKPRVSVGQGLPSFPRFLREGGAYEIFLPQNCPISGATINFPCAGALSQCGCFSVCPGGTTVRRFGEAKPRKEPLDKRIATLLADPDLARGFWGIEVVSLSTGKVLYSQNADKLFTPASNTKLFTTAATLALIGPDYKFHTTVETNGSLDKHGRLTGDLVLVGRGDPNLSGRELPYLLHTERNDHPIQVLEQLADELVQKGVKYVDGDIVADDSYFAFERYGEGWSQDDLVWADGAPVSALTINDNVIFVNILPADHVGDRAFVSITPFADYYRIDNRIITTPAGTGRKIFINREPGSTMLTLWGNMPLDDAGANEGLAIEDPAEFAAGLFRQLLESRGIAVYGRQRTRHTELASLSTLTVTALAPARGGDEPSRSLQIQPLVLGSYQSKPLIEDIRVINKVSQNLHAEILLRLLGREKGNAGNVEGGLEVVRGFLNQAGIPSEQYAFYDGSNTEVAGPTAAGNPSTTRGPWRRSRSSAARRWSMGSRSSTY